MPKRDKPTRLVCVGFSMKLHTSEFRGDHTADVCKVLPPVFGESVMELAKRAFDEKGYVFGRSINREFDWIEIRPVFNEEERPEEDS